MIKAVLFDVDDTLVDFMGIKKAAATAAVKAMCAAGLKLEQKKAEKLLFKLYWEKGIENQRILQLFLRENMGKLDYRILAAGIIAYRRAKEERMHTLPGAREVLAKLRKRYRLAAVTDAQSIQAWLRLTELDIQGYFDFVITPLETGKKKFTGLPFKLAIRKLMLQPDQIAMVGDWPARDIIPAAKLGMRTVHASYGDTNREKCAPDATIRDIRELPKVLERL